jgi:threonine/homoserine efflux transporter RhtA
MKFKLLFPLIGVITLTAFVVAFVLAVWLMTIKPTRTSSTRSDEYSREPS